MQDAAQYLSNKHRTKHYLRWKKQSNTTQTLCKAHLNLNLVYLIHADGRGGYCQFHSVLPIFYGRLKIE